MLEDTKPGEVVTVKILRGTQEKSVSVKLIEQPTK
jgi:S1-C subfamily serine protease